MKRQGFLIGLIVGFIIEVVVLVIFAFQTLNFSQDRVAVNEVLQSVTLDFHSMEKHHNLTTLDYVVLDESGDLLYKTKSGLSENLNAAISHRDTILDITIDNVIVGKVIIYNDEMILLQSQKQTTIMVLLVAIVIQVVICVIYAIYMNHAIIRPFYKLKDFAKHIAGGNLNIPLEMDRKNLFGAFTESFDIMRSELKKARMAEAQANASKKELVAKLSHDLKTPISSIKAVSEVGLAISENEKDKANYTQIICKADQINTLVSNLFTATLEELQQLTITPINIESKKVKAMLENADYLHRATILDIFDCLVYVDPLRLQQVFDNIFANAYKYAKTNIMVETQKTERYIDVIIEDYGGGVLDEELPILKEKFKRGSNATNTEGAGLGLYISDYFMKEMNGKLIIENGTNGLKVTISIPLSGKI